jgi:hypothetical protein
MILAETMYWHLLPTALSALCWEARCNPAFERSQVVLLLLLSLCLLEASPAAFPSLLSTPLHHMVLRMLAAASDVALGALQCADLFGGGYKCCP